MQIAIFGNIFRPEKEPQLERIFHLLRQQGADLYCDQQYAEFIREELSFDCSFEGVFSDEVPMTDIAISLGGDGTFLQTARRIGDKQIPILGINIGRLGFLTDTTTPEVEKLLSEVLKNYYRIEERMVIEFIATECEEFCFNRAMNEIAVLKRDSASMITIHVWVDGEYLNAYQADGLIIATPSGSTAYSLSVGGPILTPSLNNLIISPVAPHSLTVRPIVISADSVIDLEIESREQHFLVASDGGNVVMNKKNHLTIRKAPYTVRMIRRHNSSFISTIRSKLLWGSDLRNNKE